MHEDTVDVNQAFLQIVRLRRGADLKRGGAVTGTGYGEGELGTGLQTESITERLRDEHAPEFVDGDGHDKAVMVSRMSVGNERRFAANCSAGGRGTSSPSTSAEMRHETTMQRRSTHTT